MKNNKPTVTIAISAFNEEDNIVNFLKSVLIQKEEGFKLKQIWVHSDGSTDKTVALAKSLKSKKIKVWNHKKRVGKSTWLNMIYKNLDTDFLVQSDADVIFAHQFVVRDIIQPLIKTKKVGMCGGNPMPLEGTTLWEKMCRVAFEPYQDFRKTIRGGNNAFSSVGQLLAYRNELVKQINVPLDMVTNDIYTFFCCHSLGWKYRYVSTAIVLFQPPQRLKDMIKQNTRFRVGHNRMFDYFSKDLIEYEMSIPRLDFIKAVSKQFIKHSILSITYYCINKYAEIKASQMKYKLNAQWPIAFTTKRLRNTYL